MSKTREEVEALKANWLNDPCWDIEKTKGFEEYASELLNFRIMRQVEKEISSDVWGYIWSPDEIEDEIKKVNMTSYENLIGVMQVRAILLLALQVRRVADILSIMG